MRWLLRIALSFASFVLSSALCAAAIALYETRLLAGMLIYGVACLFFGTPGYLLSLLIVLTYRSVHGGQYWLFLALGSLFGPLSLTGMGLYENWRYPGMGGWDLIAFPIMLWGLSVSTLTTLIYLAAARRLRLYQQSA